MIIKPPAPKESKDGMKMEESKEQQAKLLDANLIKVSNKETPFVRSFIHFLRPLRSHWCTNCCKVLQLVIQSESYTEISNLKTFWSPRISIWKSLTLALLVPFQFQSDLIQMKSSPYGIEHLNYYLGPKNIQHQSICGPSGVSSTNWLSQMHYLQVIPTSTKLTESSGKNLFRSLEDSNNSPEPLELQLKTRGLEWQDCRNSAKQLRISRKETSINYAPN